MKRAEAVHRNAVADVKKAEKDFNEHAAVWSAAVERLTDAYAEAVRGQRLFNSFWKGITVWETTMRIDGSIYFIDENVEAAITYTGDVTREQGWVFKETTDTRRVICTITGPNGLHLRYESSAGWLDNGLQQGAPTRQIGQQLEKLAHAVNVAAARSANAWQASSATRQKLLDELDRVSNPETVVPAWEEYCRSLNRAADEVETALGALQGTSGSTTKFLSLARGDMNTWRSAGAGTDLSVATRAGRKETITVRDGVVTVAPTKEEPRTGNLSRYRCAYIGSGGIEMMTESATYALIAKTDRDAAAYRTLMAINHQIHTLRTSTQSNEAVPTEANDPIAEDDRTPSDDSPGVGNPPTAAQSTELLRQLATLRDQGIITEDEFQSKKSEILARL